MAIILGIFDLLAYAVPGSLYLTVFGYASHRAGWIDVPSVLGFPSLILLIGLAVAAFLVGQASYALGSMIDRVNPFGSKGLPDEAKKEFLLRNSDAASRRFLQLDPHILLAALEADDSEAAAEVSRLRAWQKAMRSNAFPANLRSVKGTLLSLVDEMTPDGDLRRWRYQLAEATGLPERTLDRHLQRAVDAGWLVRTVAGGNGRKAVYKANIPTSCAPKVAHNPGELCATCSYATPERCAPPGGELNKDGANDSEPTQ